MITGSFGTLVFLNPWVLAGLVFLPALWFLLRVTPPAPRLIVFPAARFVADLIPDDITSSKTPWWILLLRLLILALIIGALAKPVLNPGEALPGTGPIRIVIDNGWASAQTWALQHEEAQRLVNSAGREKREIYILTTAPEPGTVTPVYHGPMTQGGAESVLRGLKPYPWPADYNEAIKLIKDRAAKESLQSYWLSHGLREGDRKLVETLQNQGSLRYVRPDKSMLPVLLRPMGKITPEMSVLLSAPKELPAGTPVTVNAIGGDGHILDSKQVAMDVSEKSMTVTFDIPDGIRNQITQIRIAGRQGAGAVLLLDDQFKRRDVGIAAPAGESDKAPLIEESFYIERALEPYANISTGSIADLLAAGPSVMILPNVGAMPPAELNELENWVKDGGLLLRFAGPNMTQGENFLMPVPIMKGGRALDGALTWSEPVKLAPFPAHSPLYGLEIQTDIEIRRQLLAEPAPGLDSKSWAVLEDGTPLITADSLGKGLIVLVHTTATPLWSDLSLSGVFVQILRRVINLAGKGSTQADTGGQLNPLLVLDGQGNRVQPDSTVQPIDSNRFDSILPNASNPPGLYGRAGYQKSLNIGDRIDALATFASMPVGVETGRYGKNNETNLMPWVLLLAFILFIFDWFVMATMQINWRRIRPVTGIVVYMLALSSFGNAAYAQNEETMAAYAADIHLAYIKSGNPSVDQTSRDGLEALGEVLSRRTSVEPKGVVGIDPEQDELVFFPMIYWPLAQEQKNLSTSALQKIQYYIDHGGTILFDTRDHISHAQNAFGQQGGRNAGKLKELVGSLNIPPLIPMKSDHVLTKSFYLLDSFPGRYQGGTIWIEEQSNTGRDGVSSVIIGSHDWAAAWAAARNSSGPRMSGGPMQQEMSLRFGVNLMMYALTGNYKADQVHLPHILERLGQ